MLLLLFALAGVEGLWQAAVQYPTGESVRFSLEVRRHADGWTADLVNGEDRTPSGKGSFDGKRLRVPFPEWDGVLEATLEDEQVWRGHFTRQRGKEVLRRPFLATREKPPAPATASLNLEGEWILEVDQAGRAQVWRAQFQQRGSSLRGTLLPVSGDSGLLVGEVEQDRIRLSRFDGVRALLVEARLDPVTGALSGKIDASMPFTARRAAVATLAPPDPGQYTRMKNPQAAFRYPAPGWEEKLRGRPVLVSIMGSWCPNCHEEVPLLKELYETWRHRGLAVLSLGFEYTGEKERDERMLRLFADKHGIPWPVVYAGSTEDAPAILGEQLENFGAYPTTLLIGRDGRVKAIHAGFDGPSTGARHEALKRHMRELVANLVDGH